MTLSSSLLNLLSKGSQSKRHVEFDFNKFDLIVSTIPFETAKAQEHDLLSKGSLPYPVPGCFIWSMEQGLVVPKSTTNNPNFTSTAQKMYENNWPVFVRETGGDLTPQAPGMINISYVFYEPWTNAICIEDAYTVICKPIIDYLKQDFGINAYCSAVEGAFCNGKFNIVVDGLKIAGTAQKWRLFNNHAGQKHVAILGHVALLGDVPLPQMIEASNAFYKYCDIEKQITLQNHTTLHDLLGTQTYNKTTIMRGLLNSFQSSAVTSII